MSIAALRLWGLARSPVRSARAFSGLTMKTDPRMNPHVTAAFAPFGLDGEPAPVEVDRSTPMDEIQAWSVEAEQGFSGLFQAMCADNPPPAVPVERSTEVIPGVDGNDITLYISKPQGAEGPLPCIYHTHGGGMAILHAADECYVYWRDRLAAEGMVAVGVEFRNSAGADGHNQFPAGLNDCTSGLYWTQDNAEALGIGKIVISGESGGGNLAVATTMKAKNDGKLDGVGGTYALCPYVAGDLHYANPPPELPSLVENDGIFLDVGMMATLGMTYTIDENTNPLAWPLYSSASDLAGLPTTVISVNECDPLRDEGILLGQKIVDAGVDCTTINVMGTSHAADCIVTGALMDNTLRNIAAFARSVQ